MGGGVTSDRRLKADINPLTYSGIDKIMLLKPVSFLYKNVPGTIFTGGPVLQTGFIADELQNIY